MDSQSTLLIIGGLVTVAFIVIYLQIKKLTENKGADDTTKLLTQIISEMRGSMDKNVSTMASQQNAINERLDKAAQALANVSKS
ncbi:MAG TPA: hypothetical protein VLE91_04710, partial [Candidatus Saccharimonadales bacterium]|nr:hypothetical protein [Candidatus Saccharimonadales bacterium]